uniref:Uncharacterized protein n=1 Tax=Anguilla anguilla TaxID=7936 RepID=A0A0E9THG1_ANGAN
MLKMKAIIILILHNFVLNSKCDFTGN